MAFSFNQAVARAKSLRGTEVLGPRIRVKDQLRIELLTIEQFIELTKHHTEPSPSQRQHIWRWVTKKANYLNRFALPQSVVYVAVCEGKFYLLDGNTRAYAWANTPSMHKPDAVVTVFLDIPASELRASYDAVDSAKSKKTVRHEIVSLIRECGINVEKQLQSDLVLSGALKGVLKVLSGSGKAALEMSVAHYLDDILMLDTMGLGMRSVTHSGVIAAALKLHNEGSPVELVKRYVTEFVRLKQGDLFGMLACTKDIQEDALRAYHRLTLSKGTTSSESAIRAMYPVYLESFFTVFCAELSSSTDRKLARMAKAELKRYRA